MEVNEIMEAVRRMRHDPVCGSLIGKKGIWFRGQQAIL